MSTASQTVEQPLDDLMLSMDVVDTLRQNERIVERELNDEKRRADLIEKLRGIYRSQGIEVPDHILEEGVRALEESRFVYEPPKPGLAVYLARAYVTRWRWGLWAVGAVTGAIILWLSWLAFIVVPEARQERRAQIELTETLPQNLNALYEAIDAESDSSAVLESAAQLRDRGLGLARSGEREAARETEADLRVMLDKVRVSFDVTVVSRPGELSGLWRIPRVNPDSRNYYLVVEALGDDGKAIPRQILNEETRKRETVTIWAERVSKPIFDQIQSDKLDDGIIQDAVIGEKRRGELDVRWLIDREGGALTEW